MTATTAGTARPPRPERPPLATRLFGTRRATLLTLLVGALVAWVCLATAYWAVVDATVPWAPAGACTGRSGACWPFILDKGPLILFGTYDHAERWRPALASLLLLALAGATLFGRLGAKVLAVSWGVALVAFLVLMGGGLLGLEPVAASRWNGIPVLLFLAAFGLALAFPVGLVLALGRRSPLPLVARLATAYIEVIRGVPMVTMLFFGVFVLPLVVPGGRVEPIYAALAALVMFHAAYVAEDLRGGLQTVGRGQYDSAHALGFRDWPLMRYIVLPQAVRAATPALTNTAIGGFKDTSLVVIVGLHDLMATAKMAYNDPAWQGRALEAYVFVGAIFFVICWAVSAAGRRLERRLAPPG